MRALPRASRCEKAFCLRVIGCALWLKKLSEQIQLPRRGPNPPRLASREPVHSPLTAKSNRPNCSSAAAPVEFFQLAIRDAPARTFRGLCGRIEAWWQACHVEKYLTVRVR